MYSYKASYVPKLIFTPFELQYLFNNYVNSLIMPTYLIIADEGDPDFCDS